MEFKMNIVVLCGGNSTEREVSINSGSMVCEALRKKNHNAILMDVYFGLEDIDIFEKSASEYDVESVKKNIQSLSDKVSEDRRSFFGNNVIEICQKADIVFMALHGKNGEDGKCQAAFWKRTNCIRCTRSPSTFFHICANCKTSGSPKLVSMDRGASIALRI